MGKQNLIEIKQIEITILKLFVSICKKYKLQYFCVGGTALGSIRHKGFIPWDDDIDVAMPRSDYDRFIRVAQKELPSMYFLQTNNTDFFYLNLFAKIRDSKTTYIESSLRYLNMNHGIFIDIFPIDGYPSRKIDQLKIEIYKKLVYYYRYKKGYYFTNNWRYDLLNAFSSFIFLFKNPNEVVRDFEEYCKKYTYENSEFVVCHGGRWGKKEICKKSQYGKGKISEFEKIQIFLPEEIDEYLKQKYGDYMKLPPKDERISNHCTTIIDTENSFLNYINRK